MADTNRDLNPKPHGQAGSTSITTTSNMAPSVSPSKLDAVQRFSELAGALNSLIGLIVIIGTTAGFFWFHSNQGLIWYGSYRHIGFGYREFMEPVSEERCSHLAQDASNRIDSILAQGHQQNPLHCSQAINEGIGKVLNEQYELFLDRDLDYATIIVFGERGAQGKDLRFQTDCGSASISCVGVSDIQKVQAVSNGTELRGGRLHFTLPLISSGDQAAITYVYSGKGDGPKIEPPHENNVVEFGNDPPFFFTLKKDGSSVLFGAVLIAIPVALSRLRRYLKSGT